MNHGLILLTGELSSDTNGPKVAKFHVALRECRDSPGHGPGFRRALLRAILKLGRGRRPR